MATPGRKRKANFSNDETETLVWNVVRHFGALYGAEALRTHSAHRNQLWGQIQSRVNFLGYTERSVEDLKHKWRDLRLDVKRKLTSKKGPPGSCGSQKARLTPLEKMVASTFTQASPEAEPEAFFDSGFAGTSPRESPPGGANQGLEEESRHVELASLEHLRICRAAFPTVPEKVPQV